METAIRHAQLSDFERIYELINELEETVFDIEKQRAIFIENLTSKNNIYLVATEEDKVIAFLSCHVQLLLHHCGKVGEIVEMVVDSPFRKQGIGEQLISEIIKLAKEADIETLEVTSNNRREKAHRFYEKAGFSQTHQKFTLLLKS
ncbi:PhnO protein [Spirosomataceae bacterium TFI 002]|nr:PhnO protein [Spirosomataceae bacterium TFI 002]